MARASRESRSAGRVLLAALLTAVLVASLVVTGRVALVAADDDVGDDDLRAQVRFLEAAVDDDAPVRMQRLFPEGYLFTLVLTGLAVAASSTEDTADDDAARLRSLVMLCDSAQGTAPFAASADPPYGVFHAGWTLLLRVELARLSDEDEDESEVRRRAAGLRAALDASPSGLLEAYPGQSWPVDTVVAVAALNRANRLLGIPGRDPSTSRWLERVDALRDPATGLLPHRTTPDGDVLQGPRGTSQSLIQLFWPNVDPAGAVDQWRSYVDAFVVRRGVVAVGVREYPAGVRGSGDVDSGPLVLGMSASATVVTLGAARRAGDLGLARDLDRQAELAGLPVELRGERRYLGGVVPVGDAFLAFARAQPLGDPVDSSAPGVPWWLVVAVPLLPGVVAAALLVLFLRRRPVTAAGPRTAASVPPTPR